MFGFLRAKTSQHTITADEAAPLLSEKDVIFVDVREKHEWSRGHLPGARHLPLSTLEDDLNSLPKDKSIIVYCLSGARSSRAAAILRNHGITDIRNLDGGITAWQGRGLPLA